MKFITYIFNLLFTNVLNKSLTPVHDYLCSIRNHIRDVRCKEALNRDCKALEAVPDHIEIKSFIGLLEILVDYIYIHISCRGLKSALKENDRENILERLYEIGDFANGLRYDGI